MPAKKLLNSLSGFMKKWLPGKAPDRSAQVKRMCSGGAALVVMLTRRCNLRCKTCLRGDSAQQDLDLGLLDGLLDDLKKLGFTAVSLTGGEPILHPGFGEALKKIHAKGLMIGVVSNGVLYKDYLKALTPYHDRVLFTAVSLDSHLQPANDAIRGAGVYEKALEAAAAFKAAGYPLKISHVVTKENFRVLGEFVDFVNNRLGPDALNIGSAIRTEGNSALVLDREERAEFHRSLRKITGLHKNLYLTVSTGYFTNLFYCNHFNGLPELTLNSDGEMVFCCDNPYGGASLGKLGERSLAELIGRFYDAQAALKTALTRNKLEQGGDCTYDCSYCTGVLKKFLGG